jgi:hypothetical protein
MASIADPACGVHPSGPLSGAQRSGRPVSGPPVSSHLGSSSGIRHPPMWCPPVRCPARWCPPPSVRARPSGPHQAVRWDRPMRHGNPHHGNGSRSLGLPRRRAARVDGRAGPATGDAAEVTHGRRGCRRRTRAGSAAGAGPGLTLASRAGQAGVRSAGRRRLREGTGGGCAPAVWLPSSIAVGDHAEWLSWRPPPAWRGRWACRRGWGCGPSAAQAGSERSRLAADSALTCDDGWWACQDLNLGPHPYQQSRAYRYATRHFCRSCATVGGEVMRS